MSLKEKFDQAEKLEATNAHNASQIYNDIIFKHGKKKNYFFFFFSQRNFYHQIQIKFIHS